MLGVTKGIVKLYGKHQWHSQGAISPNIMKPSVKNGVLAQFADVPIEFIVCV